MELLFRAKRAYENVQKNKRVEHSSFQSNHTFEKRLNESKRILEKYPDRVPVICERIATNIPQVDRKKYLCPGDLSLANFMYVIRKRMHLTPEKALYLFVNDKMIPCSSLLSTVYDAEKSRRWFSLYKLCWGINIWLIFYVRLYYIMSASKAPYLVDWRNSFSLVRNNLNCKSGQTFRGAHP